MKIQPRLLLTLLLAALASAVAVITAAPTASDPSATETVRTLTAADAEVRTLVFAGGDSISKFYRIPAVVTLADGTIVAVADRRLDSNADLPGRIDVVSRRSTDGGRTWEDVVTVACHDDGGGYGDPGLGLAPDGSLVCVMTHGDGLWQSAEGSHAYIYTSRSTDGGRTWSTPADITAGLFSQTEGEAPVRCITAFATSGRIHTHSDGTMWFVLVARPVIDMWCDLSVYPCRSTDGGLTWEAVPVTVDTDGDESKMAELADHSLLMSIRNRRQHFRKFARSTDGGRSWTAVEKSSTLPDPAINGDIITLPDGTLIHSICNSPDTRTRVSLYKSADNAASWQRMAEVCPGGSAYSALTLLDGGRTLGVMTEEDSADGTGFRIWFTTFNLEKLLGEK